ncbi:hypothetical protein DH86_00003153, partial [Scytalidium sp. 3C]
MVNIFENFNIRNIIQVGLAALALNSTMDRAQRKNLIIDTDIFSDVDDAGALLIASTSKDVNLLAVNVNHPSRYSVLAVDAILAHYGLKDVGVGIRRPITDEHFFDSWYHKLGEYASKVAYNWPAGNLGRVAENAFHPVDLYRKVLSQQKDGSVTIASIGFLENLSALLNSTADTYSQLSGPELILKKVSELVVMGGDFPSGREYNFWGDDPLKAAHVVNNWPGRITYLGSDVGKRVMSGAQLTVEGPENDPVKA